MLTTLIYYPTEDPFYIFGAESQRFSGQSLWPKEILKKVFEVLVPVFVAELGKLNWAPIYWRIYSNVCYRPSKQEMLEKANGVR